MQVEAYTYADEQTYIDVLLNEGFTLNGAAPALPIPTEHTIEKSGERLSVHYNGLIVTNYPQTYEEPPAPEWEAIMSTEVYLMASRAGNIKLPSNTKVTGQDRTYYWNFISKFNGETL